MKPTDIIASQLFLSPDELQRYISSCPRRYKKYPIKKRSGGVRIIAQPTPDLKLIQCLLQNEFLENILPIHKCATAYRSGVSIADNARPHSKNNYLLKMDFKDFFPSIRNEDLCNTLIRAGHIGENEESELRVISRIFFMLEDDRLILSIGAPSSPFISNALLYDFDVNVSNHCEANNIVFSRYSDDLTFSTNRKNILFGIPEFIRKTLENLEYPKLSINNAKTVYSSKAHNRHVTGITITNEGNLSIGRRKKRSVRTQVFLFSKGQLDPADAKKLQGYISFARSVDPAFYATLKSKYPKTMQRLSCLD